MCDCEYISRVKINTYEGNHPKNASPESYRTNNIMGSLFETKYVNEPSPTCLSHE